MGYVSFREGNTGSNPCDSCVAWQAAMLFAVAEGHINDHEDNWNELLEITETTTFPVVGPPYR